MTMRSSLRSGRVERVRTDAYEHGGGSLRTTSQFEVLFNHRLRNALSYSIVRRALNAEDFRFETHGTNGR